jgi:hypothetical protein
VDETSAVRPGVCIAISNITVSVRMGLFLLPGLSVKRVFGEKYIRFRVGTTKTTKT